MKKIAFYLPQYHRIPENDEWWGEGFTEWDTVKKARKLEKKQIQPKVPLESNYYRLDDEYAVETLSRQAELAKKYGLYGFCFYHYWFKDDKKMLYRPMEILRDNKEIDINYMICWANEPWRRTWYAGSSEILIDQDYGIESNWINHFNYLYSFFIDERYIRIDNKPVVVLYRSASIDCLEEMIRCWNTLAIKKGLKGLYIISERNAFDLDSRKELFEAYCDFEPAHALHYELSLFEQMKRIVMRKYYTAINRIFKKTYIKNRVHATTLYKCMGKDSSYNNRKVFPGICPAWDNTPRKSCEGMLLEGSSPQLFGAKLKEYSQKFSQNDLLFINAWNEWSEGAYLEPDEENGFRYLEAIKESE